MQEQVLQHAWHGMLSHEAFVLIHLLVLQGTVEFSVVLWSDVSSGSANAAASMATACMRSLRKGTDRKAQSCRTIHTYVGIGQVVPLNHRTPQANDNA